VNFLLSRVSILALGPTHCPSQWVMGAPALGVKLVEYEAEHSLPPRNRVKNWWAASSVPLYGVKACTGTTLCLFHLLGW
jgi:hypothetical protein